MYFHLKTPAGLMAIHYNSEHRIVSTKLLSTTTKAKATPNERIPPKLRPFALQLSNQWKGLPTFYSTSDFDWTTLSKFSQKVLQATLNIPFASTLAYKGLAERVSRPRAFRAVGTALGKNPFPIVIPCHRVTKSDGGLGFYSAPGGVKTKKLLLELEQRILYSKARQAIKATTASANK